MALAGSSTENLTLDDLLEAINPRPPSPEERFRRALQVAIKWWQDGHLTDDQAEELIKALFTVKMNNEVSELISDYFAPRSRQHYDQVPRRRFSLI